MSSGPTSRPTTPPSARKGANGTPFLRPAAPWRAMIAMPTIEPTRNAASGAEVEAHHAGELDVAHPHAGGVYECGSEQHRERRGSGYQGLRQSVWAHNGGGPDPPHGQRQQDPVRNDAVLEVDV